MAEPGDEFAKALEKKRILQGLDRMKNVNMHFVRELFRDELKPGAPPEATIMGLLKIANTEAYTDVTPDTFVYALELLKFPVDLAERMAGTTRDLVGTEAEKMQNGRLADALEQYAANAAEQEELKEAA